MIITSTDTGVIAGVVGADAPCTNNHHAGLAINYVGPPTIDGFDWEAAATPVITAAAGGRRQVALSFDQESGTSYDIYRVVNGVREAAPFVDGVDGHDSDVQVVVTEDSHG